MKTINRGTVKFDILPTAAGTGYIVDVFYDVDGSWEWSGFTEVKSYEEAFAFTEIKS